ncbi:MAG: ankyrin repeat domain-containing protein [Bryobacteraceae bacterium]|nr:ankyrin repeat domain-containing protein [Bryobacteraceae bacterium]
MLSMRIEEPTATGAANAVRTGDVETLRKLLSENPELSTARIVDATGNCRTLLHVATDWPGNFPNVAQTIALLIGLGADVNATFVGPHTETPLHWAASSDDVPALDALLDHGANLEAQGGVIANGTPLADAVAFAQWKAAGRLIERGARTNLWQAAGLGLTSRMEQHLSEDPRPSSDEITSAFWCACHGGQRETAELLLGRGADLNWVGYDHLTPVQAAKRSGADKLVLWLTSRGARPAP